ncbi:MAG: DUF3098 domain-containing protein [Bacteroidota bacterium]|nr:DUF3098 domain-containing protein [Bacteroidota bacterium]
MTTVKKTTPSHIKDKSQVQTKEYFLFDKSNYKIMIIGLVTTVLGYILMVGGGSEDPNVFNPAIFDFQRLTLSPILIMAGMIIQIFAIMYKRKEKGTETE